MLKCTFNVISYVCPSPGLEKSVEGHFPIEIPILQNFKMSMSIFSSSVRFKEEELLINCISPIKICFLHVRGARNDHIYTKTISHRLGPI